MADLMNHRIEASKKRFYDVASATVIEIGDMLYLDSNNQVLPVSDFTYGDSLEETQRDIKYSFVGVALDRSRAGDTEQIAVATAGVVELDCASETYMIGDFVGINDNDDGDELEDREVVGVNAPDLAIGKVAKQYTSANVTKIWVEIFPDFVNYPSPQIYCNTYTITADDDTAGYVDFVTGWDAVPSCTFIQVKNGSTNRNKGHDFESENLTGANAGTVRISDGYSSTLDEGDILSITIYR